MTKKEAIEATIEDISDISFSWRLVPKYTQLRKSLGLLYDRARDMDKMKKEVKEKRR